MVRPSPGVESFARRVADELQIMGLGHEDRKFYNDPLAGPYRRAAGGNSSLVVLSIYASTTGATSKEGTTAGSVLEPRTRHR